MKNNYKRLINGGEEDLNFWPTFTDLLSTILLVILIIFVAVIISINKETKEMQNKVKANQLEMDKQAKQIAEKEKQIEMLSYIQKDIVKDLESEFKSRQMDISIDKDTGAIKFKDDLLFEEGMDVITPKFRDKLQAFIPIYFSTLYGKYGDHIAEIVVEGHTDDKGEYMYNLDLSQRRAFSVVRYILSEFPKLPFKDQVEKNITANGRSKSQLKLKENGAVDREQSRRVEFKFRLKNSYEGNQITSGN
ncbi:OmpA family protein [Neobacillus sp. NPDC093127]|uniref:OmpA family protein n=1 Tax=Neobacillus sp. NPDC093127 TaxID=3364296 RepID=UPI003802F837